MRFAAAAVLALASLLPAAGCAHKAGAPLPFGQAAVVGADIALDAATGKPAPESPVHHVTVFTLRHKAT